MFLDNVIPRIIIRSIAGTAGVIIGLISIAVPLNFYLNLFPRFSALPRQGQLSFWDGVSGMMIVPIFFAVFGFISLLLIKFALTRPGSTESHPDDSSNDISASPHSPDEHATQQ